MPQGEYNKKKSGIPNKRETNSYSLACPICGIKTSGVIDSRPTYKHIRRRRVCSNGHRFTTHEIVIQDA